MKTEELIEDYLVYTDNGIERVHWCNVNGVKELVSPKGKVYGYVPDYFEVKRLREQLNEANEVIKKFEKTEIGHKQKDGTYMLIVCGVIIDPEKSPTSAVIQKEMYVYDPRPLTKYLEKYNIS